MTIEQFEGYEKRKGANHETNNLSINKSTSSFPTLSHS